MKNPKARMWFGFVIASVLIGLALFLSAGTTNYWQAWVYLGVGAASGVLLTLSILRDPILLENRTKGGPAAEQRSVQKIIVLCMGFPAIAAFIIPGLDRRFGWSNVPSMALHSRRPPDYSESLDGVPGIQRKLFWLHDRRDHQWPKSDHDRPLRHRTQSDVFKRGSVLYRAVLGARFLLGTHRFCPHDLRPRLEAV